MSGGAQRLQGRGEPQQRLEHRPAAGLRDVDGEPTDVTARRELAEETGLRADGFAHLGHLDLAPGLSTQEFDVWLATDLTPGPTAREATEADMVAAFVTEDELRAMIRDGRLTDGPSLAAYALLLLSRV